MRNAECGMRNAEGGKSGSGSAMTTVVTDPG